VQFFRSLFCDIIPSSMWWVTYVSWTLYITWHPHECTVILLLGPNNTVITTMSLITKSAAVIVSYILLYCYVTSSLYNLHILWRRCLLSCITPESQGPHLDSWQAAVQIKTLMDEFPVFCAKYVGEISNKYDRLVFLPFCVDVFEEELVNLGYRLHKFG
jgi:hypothetical protein